jgi:3D domain protein
MITGEIRSKVDKIWEIFWTGGITNPLSVIEQFTYLIFIKSLDDKQIREEKNSMILGLEPKRYFSDDEQILRWSNFKELEAQEMFDVVSNRVFPFIKNLNGDNESSFSKYMKEAIFQIPTPQMLEKIVTGIETLEFERDVKGDLYEYLLSKLATSGTNGQFRTPRHIIDMMVKLVKPDPQDIIIDPACGTSGFLVGVEEYLKKKSRRNIYFRKFKRAFSK